MLAIAGPNICSFAQNSDPDNVSPDSTDYPVVINYIVISGNRLTKEQIITRELSVKTGDSVGLQTLAVLINRDQKKLMNTRLFNTVSIRTVDLDSSRLDVIIEVNERWYTFPIPIFELSDRNFNEWWQNYDHDFNRVNYGLRLYQFNARGRNETLRLTLQSGYTKKFELYYKMPYLDKRQRHGLSFNIEYKEAKNVAYQTLNHKLQFLESRELQQTTTSGYVQYTFRHSFYEYHTIGFEALSAKISDSVRLLNPEYFDNEQKTITYTSLFYDFVSDHRDILAYPLHGYYSFAHFQQYGLRKSDVHKTEASVGFARFIDLRKGYYLSNYIYGYWSLQNDLPYFMYGGLGYKKIFIRGFERYVIESPQFALTKFTLKKLIFSRTYRWEAWPIEQFRHIPISIYIKTYGDLGYAENYPSYSQNSRFSDKIIGGTGMGIDIVGSYDFVLRFEYSLNSFGSNGLFIHVKKEF